MKLTVNIILTVLILSAVSISLYFVWKPRERDQQTNKPSALPKEAAEQRQTPPPKREATLDTPMETTIRAYIQNIEYLAEERRRLIEENIALREALTKRSAKP